MKLAIKSAVAFALASAMLPAIALRPEYTQADLSTLPVYCDDTEGFNHTSKWTKNQSPRGPYWESVMGPDFWWMHHYCWALLAINKSERPMTVPGWTKKRHLENARMELVSTIHWVNDRFVLLPEIYTKLGEVEVELSKFGELSHTGGAYSAFLSARTMKPDYWPAYAGWARVLIQSGQKKEAEKLLRSGLEYSPDSSVLKELYRSVGGDQSTIVPVARAVNEAKNADGSGEEPQSAAPRAKVSAP